MKPDWESKVRTRFAELQAMPVVITSWEGDDLSVDVFPNVFSPALFFESGWFAVEVKKIVDGKSLLEIGTGTGIVALMSALNGSRVAVTDVNEAAIQNAKHNFKNYNVDAQFFVGDVFEPLSPDNQFDFIFWNHPFNSSSDRDNVFLKSVFDLGYRALDRYIGEAKKYLTGDGRLLLGTSSIADLETIDSIARRHDYTLHLVSKIDRETEIDGTHVDFRIYELTL